jgi:hypothetical protein
MAIVTLNGANGSYSVKKMPTKNSKDGPINSPINTAYKSDQSAFDFQLYRDDATTRQTFSSDVGVTNPVRATMEKSDGFASQPLTDHAYEYINKFKICEIAMGSAGAARPIEPSNGDWGNWRTSNPAGIPVFGNVFLFPDDKTFQFSYTNNFGKAWEAVDPGGISSKVSQLAETARSFQAVLGSNMSTTVAGKLMSRYKEAPSWTGTDPIKIGSNLKFTFQFGQAGVFSGEHEVVRPILALASLWVPIKTDESYYRGILPTPPFMQMMALKTFNQEGGIGSLINELLSGGSEGGVVAGAIQGVTNVEQKLIKIQELAIAASLDAAGSRALYIRMGRLVMGPYIVKDVNWDFDFTHTDEYGFPYKGSITFGGLESALMPDANQISFGWSYDKDLRDMSFENNPDVKKLYAEQQNDTITPAKVEPSNNKSGQTNPLTLREEAEQAATAGRASAGGKR